MPIDKRVLADQRNAAQRTEQKLDFLLSLLGWTCDAVQMGRGWELQFHPIENGNGQGLADLEAGNASPKTKRGRPKKTVPDTGEE